MCHNPRFIMWLLYLLPIILISMEFQVQGAVRFNLTNHSLHCDTDRDCPEYEYCYNIGFMKTKSVCVNCTDCVAINRKSAIRCARSWEDCGECLPGFSGSKIPEVTKWCYEVEEIQAQTQTRDFVADISHSAWTVVAIFCITTFAGFALYHFVRRQRLNQELIQQIRIERNVTNTSEVEAANGHLHLGLHPPPPYYEEDERSNTFELRISEQSVIDQKAVPYLWEDISEGNHPVNRCRDEMEEDEVESGHTDDDENNGAASATVPSIPPTNIDLHDESTIPSLWTPGCSYSDPAEAQSGRAENVSPPSKRKKIEYQSKSDVKTVN